MRYFSHGIPQKLTPFIVTWIGFASGAVPLFGLRAMVPIVTNVKGNGVPMAFKASNFIDPTR
jgi:hypothetical protein